MKYFKRFNHQNQPKKFYKCSGCGEEIRSFYPPKECPQCHSQTGFSNNFDWFRKTVEADIINWTK